MVQPEAGSRGWLLPEQAGIVLAVCNQSCLPTARSKQARFFFFFFPPSRASYLECGSDRLLVNGRDPELFSTTTVSTPWLIADETNRLIEAE